MALLKAPNARGTPAPNSPAGFQKSPAANFV